MANTPLFVDSTGMVHDEKGNRLAKAVDNVLGEIGSFASADVLILRLYQYTDHRHGRTSATSDAISYEDAHQFLIQESTAERMIEMLEEYLRTVRGHGATRQ